LCVLTSRVLLTAAFGVDIGLDSGVAQVIMQTIDKDASGTIDFVEFVSYIPFFVRLHQEILRDPLSLDAPPSETSDAIISVVAKDHGGRESKAPRESKAQ
jgi:hypothetical protein